MRGLVVPLLLAVAGCGGGSEQRLPAAPQRQSAVPPSAAEIQDGAAQARRFCGELARIVDGEPEAFAPLRGAETGIATWEGRIVPVGLRECRVEGDYHPGASYVCRGETIAGGSGDLLLPRYRALAADLDDCLRQPIWFPRLWRQGQDFGFAGGERQTIWRDGSTGPKPVVALKVEEDLARRVYFLRLAVATGV